MHDRGFDGLRGAVMVAARMSYEDALSCLDAYEDVWRRSKRRADDLAGCAPAAEVERLRMQASYDEGLFFGMALQTGLLFGLGGDEQVLADLKKWQEGQEC